jgi:hypothetical protein
MRFGPISGDGERQNQRPGDPERLIPSQAITAYGMHLRHFGEKMCLSLILYNCGMKRSIGLGLVLAMAVAAQTAPPASQVMETAGASAAQQHKSIFLIFHASW